MHPYFDHIAIVKYLNQQFGYHLTTPEFLHSLQSDSGVWTEWALDMHLAYAEVFNERTFSKLKPRIRERLERKGNFSIMYEMPRRNE